MTILGISGFAGSGKDQFAKYLRPFGATSVALADPLKRIARDVYAFTDDQLWGPSASRNAPDSRYPRPHTWQRSEFESSCPCCGQTTTRRRVEDDLFVENEDLEDGIQPCFLTPRYALQMLGTEWGRHCYPDTWASLCVRTAGQLLGKSHYRYDPKKGLYWLQAQRVSEQEDEIEESRTKIVAVTDVRFRNEMRIIRAAGGKLVRVRRPGAGLKGSAALHPSELEQAGIPDSDFDFVIENNETLEHLRARACETAQRFAR